MNTTFRSLFALGALLGLSAAHAADFDDYARVTRVTPRVQQVNEPREVCHTEIQQTDRGEHSAAGSVIGGVTGALLGSRFGRGDGRTASAAVGAIAGAVVGDQIDNGDNRGGGERQVRRCHTEDNWVSRNQGFQVDYEYRGHQYSTVTSYDPGDRMPVRVSVAPATR